MTNYGSTFMPKNQAKRREFLVAALKGERVVSAPRPAPILVGPPPRSSREIAEAMFAFANSGMSRKRYSQVMRRETQVKDAT